MRKEVSKRGVSAVVATVLIIMITIAVIAIVWVAILPMIRDSLSIGNACKDVDLTIEDVGYTCYASNNSTMIQIKKGSSDAKIVGANIIISSDGNSYSYPQEFDFVRGQSKVFYVNTSNISKVEKIGVAAVVKNGNKEKSCSAVYLENVKECAGQVVVPEEDNTGEDVGELIYALEISYDKSVDFGINWSKDLILEMEMFFTNEVNSRTILGSDYDGGRCYLKIDSSDVYGNLNEKYFQWNLSNVEFDQWHNYTFYSNGSNPLIDGNSLDLELNESLENYNCENLSIKQDSSGGVSYKVISLKIFSDKTGLRELLNHFVAKPKENFSLGNYYGDYPGCFQDIQNGNKEYCSNTLYDFNLVNATSGEALSGNGGSY